MAGMVCLPEQLNNLKGESPSIIGEDDCHSRKSSEINVQRKPALKRIVSSKYGNTFDRSCVYTQYTSLAPRPFYNKGGLSDTGKI